MPQDFQALEEAVLAFIKDGRGSFEELLCAVHAYQLGHCPVYAAYCGESRIDSPSQWTRIPALPLDAFRQARISCFSPEQVIREFRTSGTTGEGYGTHAFPSLRLYEAAALQGWRRAGLPMQNVRCLMPSPRENPYSSLSCMGGWLAGEDRFYWQQWSPLVQALREETAPVLLFGSALAFLDFFEALQTERLTLPEGSVAVETGGYKGTRRHMPKADLYSLFELHLGLPPDSIYNEYGMTELSSQFYTQGLSRPHAGGPWVRGLVLNPETGEECADGETGVLRIFDLANVASCCALQTRDLAIKRGDAFELIGRDPSALPRGCSRAADDILTS